ncbi:MAG: DUF483 domain-containing protein [Myxococcota bacterium]
MKSSILLIEFVIIDRFHCGFNLPYLNGVLKRRGIKCLYLRSGLLAGGALGKDNRVNIDKESVNHIILELKSNRYTDIIFSHRPSESFISQIKKFTSNIYFIETFDNSKPNISEFYERYKIDEKGLFEEVPDFGFTNINRLAEEFRPLPHLILFNECNYRRPIIENPFYKDIKLPEYVKNTGCSFCIRPDTFKRERFDKIKITQHISAAINTTPWNGFRRRLRIIGELIVRNIDEFFKTILRNGIDDTDFLFNFRVDNFLKNKDKIEKGLKIISGAKNRFYLTLVGIENFSNDELLRYNKGIKNYDILEFLSLLFELKQRYPGHFDYEEYGGFSLILFNPFTTREDLRLNYHIIKYLNIEKLCGKLSTSRIRLYKELPIYHLAQENSLIIKRYESSIFDTAQRNFYRDEIPWRYKHKDVEQFNKYLTINKSKIDKSKDLNLPIIKLNKEYLLSHKHITGIEKDCIYKSNISLNIFYKIEKEFMDIYKDRKIGKKDINNEKELRTHLRNIRKYFSYIKVVQNRSQIGGLRHNIYYSNSGEFIKKDDRILDESSYNDYLDYINIGRLLGYPECCSEHYGRMKYYLINNYLFALMHLRYQFTEIFKSLNPFSNLIFIPCSLRCKKAKVFVDIRTNVIKRSYINYNYENLTEYPFVFLLPYDPFRSVYADNLGYVVVKPRTEVEDEFSYEPLLYSGNDRRLRFIINSDRLVMRDGFMELYKGRRHIYTFCAEANVWYYKKPLDCKFWKAFTEAYYRSIVYRDRYERNKYVSDTDLDKLFRLLKESIGNLNNSDYRLIDVGVERNVVVALLTKKGRGVELRIQKREETDKYYIRGKRYSISVGRIDEGIDFLDEVTRLVLRIIEDEER